MSFFGRRKSLDFVRGFIDVFISPGSSVGLSLVITIFFISKYGEKNAAPPAPIIIKKNIPNKTEPRKIFRNPLRMRLKIRINLDFDLFLRFCD